jgi:putative flippase GtrA
MTALLRQLSVFTAAGAVGTAAHYLVLVGLVQGSKIDPVLASSAGFLTGAVINYILNYHFTFRSTKSHRVAMPRFFAVAAIGMVLNSVIMAALTRALGWHYLVAQVISTGLVLLWNFAGNRLWTFREKADG